MLLDIGNLTDEKSELQNELHLIYWGGDSMSPPQ